MSKRLISTDERSEAILTNQQKNGRSLSSVVNEAIWNEFIPVYSPLRVEALYLLDCISKSPEHQYTTSEQPESRKTGVVDANRNISLISREALGRGVAWLSRHHIKKADVLQSIVDHFCQSLMSGSVPLEDLNTNIRNEINDVRTKLLDIDSNFNDFDMGLGSLGKAVLNQWDMLWDWNNSYNIIMSVVYCENLHQELNPFNVIQYLQWIESQVIVEAIDE